jgi:hypothetical protein
VILAGMGIASIWAFVEPKYQNAPDNVPLTYFAVPAPQNLAAVQPANSQSPTVNYEL